jgi:hypothetical protein
MCTVLLSLYVFALNKSIEFLDLVSWHHKHMYNQGRREGGREGSSAPPHHSKIFLTLGIFFSKILVAPISKTHKGANIFQVD